MWQPLRAPQRYILCEAWYKSTAAAHVQLVRESVLALMVESSEQVANLRSEGLKAIPRTASLCAGSACSMTLCLLLYVVKLAEWLMHCNLSACKMCLVHAKPAPYR